jgi:hypothetical protein
VNSPESKNVVTPRRKERRRDVEGERIKEMRACRSLAGNGRTVSLRAGGAALLHRAPGDAFYNALHVRGNP